MLKKCGGIGEGSEERIKGKGKKRGRFKRGEMR